MRILLTCDPIIPVPPQGYGGIERIADALLRYYRAHGHTVGLVALEGSTAEVDFFRAWPAGVQGRAETLRNAFALRRAAQEFRPDVVHSFSRLVYLLPLLAGRQKLMMSYQRHTGGKQIALAARLGGSRLLFTGCSEFICGMGRPQGGTWIPVPNFIEPEKIRFTAQVPPDAPLVFLSRLDDIKGPDLAIAIAKAAKRRLILAGNRATSGKQADFFEREIAPHLGRDGIEWIGEVNDAQKSELLAQAAAMIVPIRWNEPFGIVFAEALAAGTPVISCANGALPEIVTPGRTGFFIHSVEDGVAAVEKLPTLSRTECRQVALEKFSLAACAPRYLELYASLVS